MNKTTTFLLGTAAAMVVAGGAQAADPIFDVAEPREPVYRCDITGFIELPGTDICFKVGGYARLVATAASKEWLAEGFYPGTRNIVPGGINAAPGGGAFFGWGGNTTNMYGQGRLNFDARTATEFGTVRGFIEIQASDAGNRTGGAAALRHAFVQFGNWTFGKTWSTFNHLASSAPATDPYVVVGDSFIRRNQIRYTQPFGNGFSLSVAIEDQAYNNPAPVNAFPTFNQAVNGIPVAPISAGIVDRRGLPDLVANLNVAGDWGSAQVSGALHKNEARTAVGWPSIFSSTDSSLGWAAMFGLNLNVPTTEGSNFGFKATYLDGASQYMQDLYAGNLNTVWGNRNPIAVNDSIIDEVEQWSILAWYQHFWTPAVSTSIGAGYAETDFGGTSPLTGWFHPFLGVNMPAQQVDQLQVFANVAWTPVANTTFVLEGHWGRIDYNGYGGYQPLINAVEVGAFGAPLTSSKEDAFAVTFQATRSF